MAIFKKQEIVATFPVCNIVRRESHKNYEQDGVEAINITSNEIMVDSVEIGGGSWVFSSIINYALENNKCPITAYAETQKKGHPLYWVSQVATIISNRENVTKTDLILIETGDIVRFEGQLFIVENAPNNNKSLVPIIK